MQIILAHAPFGGPEIHDSGFALLPYRMSIPLSEATFRLVDGKNFAVLATVNPGGSPQTSVAWAGRAAGTAKRTAARGLRRTRRRGTGLGVMVREPDAKAARWMALDLAASGSSVAVARVPGEPLPARTGRPAGLWQRT